MTWALESKSLIAVRVCLPRPPVDEGRVMHKLGQRDQAKQARDFQACDRMREELRQMVSTLPGHARRYRHIIRQANLALLI